MPSDNRPIEKQGEPLQPDEMRTQGENPTEARPASLTGRSVRLPGRAASPGVLTARAFVYRRDPLPEPPQSCDDPAAERERLARACAETAGQLAALVSRTRERLGPEQAAIFRSQQTVAEDESIQSEIADMISTDLASAERAVQEVLGQYIALFEQLPEGDYNRGRATDVADVRERILRRLAGLPEPDLSAVPGGALIVATDLMPSDTGGMDPARVAGILTELGGVTSHVAILSRNLGIPAAVGVGGILDAARTGDLVFLDSASGRDAEVLVRPDPDEMVVLEHRAARWAEEQRVLAEWRDVEPRTADGTAVTLSANIGSSAEIAPARAAGARSVGLFRSEFLFLERRNPPDEEEQYRAYRKAAEAFSDGFVIVRTLDVGGDKQVPGVSLPEEENPFLGVRGIRVSLAEPVLFRQQLRAIYRAAAHGPLQMMFPMVGGLPELREALDAARTVRDELSEEGAEIGTVPTGVMVEVPSAVFLAPELARMVDFFSIGTNDLTQYLCAADRMSAPVARYYREYDPAVFRAIDLVVRAAEAAGRWVGVCGELGGNLPAIPALVGLGVRELSMSARSIPAVTRLLSVTSMQQCQDLARQVLGLDTDTAVGQILLKFSSERTREWQ